MLTLTQKRGDSIYVRDVDGNLLVQFTLTELRTNKIRVGITADPALFFVDRGQARPTSSTESDQAAREDAMTRRLLEDPRPVVVSGGGHD